MMSSHDRQTYDDRVLTRYLLGALPAEEAERLDEQSIADDELAGRLSAVENDLVDAYVRSELSGEDLEQFKSFYLSSPKRRQKVEFAAAWREHGNQSARAHSDQLTQAGAALSSRQQRVWRPLSWRAFQPQWGFAAAALVVLLAAGYLLVENRGLRKQVSEAQAQQAALAQHDQELEKQLDKQRALSAESLKEIERLHQSPSPEQLRTVSLLLPPPTRSLSRPPTISLRPGTDLAVLLLALESDDFPSYRAALKDPATGQILWASGKLAAASLGENKAISISFPASLLKQQNYIVEVAGLSARGAPEVVGGYPFRVSLD